MGFLASLFNRPPKLNVYDLLYIYHAPWDPLGESGAYMENEKLFP